MPWVMFGDFNCIKNAAERISATVRNSQMEDINKCMFDCGLDDTKCCGDFYTWNNK